MRRTHLRTPYHCSACILWILLACSLPEVSGSDRAGDLIQEARQYDGMYSLGPQVSPDSAISLYNKALQVDPNDPQKLHILNRLAQLYVYSDRPDNHTRAIGLNKQIMKGFPADELAVLRAMNSLAQHYRALGQNMKALEWAKRTVNYSADPNQTARSRSAPDQGETPQAYQSRRLTQQIRLYKEVAVDKVAFYGNLIDPLVADAELRRIASDHPGTYLSEKAHQLLEEIAKEPSVIAKIEDLLNAPWDGIPAGPQGTTLQPGASAALATKDNDTSEESVSPANAEQTRTAKGHNTTADDTSLAQANDTGTRTSRGPPFLYVVAGLSIAGLAASLGVYARKGMKAAKSSEV